jgi:hypothetical protein
VKILQLECCSQKKNIEAKDWVQPFWHIWQTLSLISQHKVVILMWFLEFILIQTMSYLDTFIQNWDIKRLTVHFGCVFDSNSIWFLLNFVCLTIKFLWTI